MPRSNAVRTGLSVAAAKAKPRPEARPRPAPMHSGLKLSTATKIPMARAPLPMARRFLLIATAIWAEACAEEGLSHLEFGTLGALSRQPDIDRNGLAAVIGVDRTNIGLIIDQLEKRGFVERTVNPEDRRAQRIHVTPAGEETFNRQARKTAIAREKILAPLKPEEREKLYDLLERIIAANEQYSIPGAGRRKRSR